MNILFVFSRPIDSEKGGVERVTSLLSEELTSRGHSITYLCTHGKSENCNNTLDNQFFIDWINDPINAIQDYNKLIELRKIECAIFQEPYSASIDLMKHTRQENIINISVVHTQPLQILHKERYIFNSSFHNGIKQHIKKYVCRFVPAAYRIRYLKSERKRYIELSHLSDKIVLLSNKYIERICEYIPNLEENVLTAIPNPSIAIRLKNPPIDCKEKIILYVGRVENYQKNVIGFIQMWKQLHNLHPDWKAFIVGDGPDRESCERYVKEKCIKNIYFEGLQSRVEPYYIKASFVCLSSIFEGFPMALVEGMSFGCIPVCFNSFESCSDIIENDCDGIIVPAFDYQEMASRISSVINDSDKMKSMSNKARTKISRYDISNIVVEWESLISSL